MPDTRKYFIIYISIFLISIVISTCKKSDIIPPVHSTIINQAASDGAWNWCGDPRGVYFKKNHEKTYYGYVTSNGSIFVSEYNHADGKITHSNIHDRYDSDDHDNPILFVRNDGRIMAFYQKHHDEKMIRYRVSKNPEDISKWQDFRIINMPSGVTYIHIFQLAKENNRIYLYTRCIDWKPTMIYSDDNGETWSKPVKIIDSGKFGRPYIKVVSDNQATIHFAFTDDHPRDAKNNNVYYMYYQAGFYYNISGKKLADCNTLPVQIDNADVVYSGNTNGRAWTWDIALDKNRYPVIVFTVSPTEDDHRYYYSRWNSRTWTTSEITKGGRWFPQTIEGKNEPEPHYSGGLTLDHQNPSIVYTSRQYNQIFEIEQWQTHDKGITWTSKSVTSNSTNDNVRPFVVWNNSPESSESLSMVFWMNNLNYVHYDGKYKTQLQYTFSN